MEKRVIKTIARTLATASQLILASPLRLPPRVVAVAQYVSLGLAVLDALENVQPENEPSTSGPDQIGRNHTAQPQDGEPEAPAYGY